MEQHAASAYLHRIGVRGPVPPTAETLRQLHDAHLLAVPFENLSIHWQEPIVLSDDALFEKIVVRRRGGFCYERNGLFAALLRSLGFNVTIHEYADYEELCRHYQTSPHSHFTQQRICSRATIDGRISLSPRRLIRTRGRVREEIELATEAEYTNALRELFGIIPIAPASRY